MHFRDSSIGILLANALPVAGVLWFGWDVLGILLLYWAESVVIGLINILRIARCEPRGALSNMQTLPPLNRTASLRYHHLPGLPSAAVKLFLIPFFIVHYGLFCFAHLAAIVSLFAPVAGKLSVALPALWPPEFWIPVAALFLSHLFSFFSNFIGYKEYRRTNVMALMTQPYARILIMQITIIAGSALIIWLGSALPMLIVLIAVKTIIDLRFHEKERRRFAASH
jgi:Family of unknown function (DUF6498)